MAAATEEASYQTAPDAAPASAFPATEAVSIAGVPYATILLLLICAWILFVSGGFHEGLALPALLEFGAKATPLILDRGETWRLFAANLLHKDILHFAFNAFAIWNVGGALERAVRPADYVALLIYTALGTTLVSAIGADSISLGASGIAFGLLGASATFGWRRGVRGKLRSYFGLRIVPWMFALFAAGVGSSGVDNWGHAGGLVFGTLMGGFLSPRAWPGDRAARRLSMAIGAAIGTLALGVCARPMLPLLGPAREGPADRTVEMPLGWRRATSELGDRVSYTNGLTGTYRSSATLVQGVPCKGAACACDKVVGSLLSQELWRLADLGIVQSINLGKPVGDRVDGTLFGDDGEAQVSAVCLPDSLTLVVLQPPGGSGTLVERMAHSLQPPP